MNRTRVSSTSNLKAVAMFAALLSANACFGAGFDCSKANGVEKRICSDYQLSNLDLELNVAYKLARSSEGYSAAQIAQQRKWIAEDRNRCTDKACLVRAYTQRIEALQSEVLHKPARCAIGEADLRGVWRGLNESQFEELEISMANDERQFSSWRHSRPEYDGSWVFKDCNLRLADAAADKLVFDYLVYGIVDGVLYLKRTGRDEASLYRRVGF